MRVRALSVHAGYGCRRSGACCTAGWPIPVEADRFARIDLAVASGQVAARPTGRPPWVRRISDTGTEARLDADHTGCVFFDRERAIGRCRLQGALGHEALPLACRQFPRVSLHDPRGVSVTLSHYCPTAAALLDETDAVVIRDDGAAFPPEAEYVGLDVRRNLPPLLRPELLMDWEAWWEWERRAVALLDDTGRTPKDALAALAAVVEVARQWSPGQGSLAAWIERAFRTGGAHRPRTLPDDHLALVLDAIPDDLRPGPMDRPGRPAPGVARRFLAAHAFASWTAHLGQGLRSWLHGLDTALALLDLGLGVRQADLLLRHLADPGTLATSFSRAERS